MQTGTRRAHYSPGRQMSRPADGHEDFEFTPVDRRRSSSREPEEPRARGQQPATPIDEELAEEVYVCNCCCLSKELAPGIKFMSTFKSLFFLFNFLVFAFGFASFGMGLWFRIDPKVYEIHKYIDTQNFTIAGWTMLAAGFSASLISLLGFGAAARNAAGLLALYFVVIVTLILASVGTLVLLTVYGLGYSLESFLIKEIYEQIRRKSINTDLSSFAAGDAAQFLDFIQVKMRCCGALDFRDYAKLGMVVPTTCYSIGNNYVSAPGCGRSIRELLDLRAGLGAGFTAGCVVSQLMTAVLSALMFCSIYHWRANSRPMTPIARSRASTPSSRYSPRQLDSPHLRRPRSRTPIIL